MQTESKSSTVRLYSKDILSATIKSGNMKATGLSQKDPRIDLTGGVVIEIYDTKIKLNSDIKPPMKAKITSQSGIFMKAKNEESGEMQDIVILEGDVDVLRYAKAESATEQPEVEARIKCDKARWNHTTGILNGYGLVDMTRADRTLKLTGKGMVYQINRENQDNIDLTDDNADLGGVLEVTSDVEMIIYKKNRDGTIKQSSKTIVTSQGPARYDFDKLELYFSEQVNVLQKRMHMVSDYLRLILTSNESKDKNRLKEMVAWCDKVNNVVITGSGDPRGKSDSIQRWRAQAQYAVYKENTGELLLTEERPSKTPKVNFEDVMIRNDTIRFFMREERLLANGKNGLTILNAALDSSNKSNRKERTEIRFKKQLFLDQKKNLALFTGDVELKNAGMVMNSDELKIDFANKNIDTQKPTIKKAEATGHVRLLHQGRRAKCQKLEILPNTTPNPKPNKNGLILFDSFILSGMPLPEIEIPGGGYFQAKKIHVNRYRKRTGTKRIVKIVAFGPGSGSFGKDKDELGNPITNNTNIRYSKKMIYDELEDLMDFYGEVTASSGDQVLSSDRLIARLVSTAKKGNKDEDQKQIQRLTAVGNAKMHWGIQHAEADKLDRKLPVNGKGSDRILLLGSRNRQARVWEENGASFQGPWITASGDGSVIYSKGGGELSMLDRDTNEKALVTYSGDAYYSVNKTGSIAIFRKNVVMRRGNMQVTGDKMRADLVKTSENAPTTMEALSKAGGAAATATLPRKLKRVTVEGKVIVRQGKRIAFGQKGQVDIGDRGDVMLLAGKPAEVNDNNGFTLFAPRIMIKEASGITTASGPGQVRIVSTDNTQRGADGTAKKENYLLDYDGKLLYNQLNSKIRFEKNVRMKQKSLQGRCESLTIFLTKKDGTTDAADSDDMEIANIESKRNVRFKVAPGSTLSDPTGTQGSVTFTKSSEAHYDAKHGVILLAGSPAEAITQTSSGGSKTRFLQQANRMWYTLKTSELNIPKVLKQSMLPSEGPIVFPSDR